jgi:hypothetical protein
LAGTSAGDPPEADLVKGESMRRLSALSEMSSKDQDVISHLL